MLPPVSENSFLECGICNENYIDPHMTRCGHTYCKPCITMWISKNPSCPACREPVTETFPNIFARQAAEEAAKKAEACAKPIVASETIRAEDVEHVTKLLDTTTLAKSPVVDKKIQDFVKPIVSPTPYHKTHSTALAPALVPKPSSAVPNGPPLVVDVTLFNPNTHEIQNFRMPQVKGNGNIIAEAYKRGTLSQIKPEGTPKPAKVFSLIIEPAIDLKDFLIKHWPTVKLLPTKTFSKIHGLQFQDETVVLTTEKGELYYRIENSFCKIYQDVKAEPNSLQAFIRKTLLNVLSHPCQLQITLATPLGTTKDMAVVSLNKALVTILNKTTAKFIDIIELNHPADQNQTLFVGQTLDVPYANPIQNEPLGAPITIACQIDELESVLKMLGRIT